MSVTTTQNAAVYTILADYDLHHSNPSSNTPAPPTNRNAPEITESRNPSYWDDQHRRVPGYRPINRELDQSERRVFQNGIERTFIGTMFTGVWTMSTVAQVWHKTAGKVWDVGYKIGGEW